MTDFYTRPDGTQIAISAMGRWELIDVVRYLSAELASARSALIRAVEPACMPKFHADDCEYRMNEYHEPSRCTCVP